MEIVNLETALKEFIEEVTEEYILPVPGKKQEERRIKVLTGFLPPESAEEEIPAIVVRFLRSRDTEEERFLDMKIVASIFEKDTQKGYKKLVEILKKIIDEIHQKRFIGKYFECEGISKWSIDEEQPYPFWMGEAELVFRAPKTSYPYYR